MNRTNQKYAMRPTEVKVDLILEAKATIGEGPLWSAEQQRLYWTDIPAKQLNIFNPADGSNQTFALPQMVTSISTRRQGGLLLSLRDSFAFFEPKTGKLEVLTQPEADRPGNRFNDGKCDRQGRLWAGTMGDLDWDSPVGNLYRLDASGKAAPMERGVCCSNGLGFSPDSETMYFAESFRHRIWAYDFDAASGDISNRRVFASIDPEGGRFPDGLTVDAEGFVWSAQPMLGCLVRYDPAGGVERIIELPVSRGTSCIFGGQDLDVLYVTTMRATLTEAQLAQEPLAGSLLALRPGVKGIAETPFAG